MCWLSLRLFEIFEVSGNFLVLFQGDKDGYFSSTCMLMVALSENHILS